MELPKEKLIRSLESTDFIEVLQSSSAQNEFVNKVAVQFRVNSGVMPQWLSVVDFLLQEEEEQDDAEKWSLHICKTFMRDEERLGFVWTIVLSTKRDIRKAVTDVSRALRVFCANLKNHPEAPQYKAEASRPRAVQRAAQVVANRVAGQDAQPSMHNIGDKIEVDIMPLIGVTEDRNRPTSPNGKGARLIQGR